MYLRDRSTQHIHEFCRPAFIIPRRSFSEGMLVLAGWAACRTLSKGSFTESLFLLVWAHERSWQRAISRFS